jgi:hypothetical protein
MTSNFDLKRNSHTPSIVSETMTSAFSGKNNFSTKSIVRRNMSKSAQQNKQQRKEIREQFLKELYNKEESEHGISIFDEKVYKPKRFRTEIKVPMERIRPTQVSAAKVQVKAVKPRKPKIFKSSVNITLRRPTQPKPAPMERKAEVPLGPRPPSEHWNKPTSLTTTKSMDRKGKPKYH